MRALRPLATLAGLALAACASSAVTGLPPEDEAPLPPPVQLTAEEDHARTLEMLGIDELRPGRDGMNPDAPNYANYDEATSNPYPNLPPLLVFEDGTQVTDASDWPRRRAELILAFDAEVYGRTPDDLPGVSWEVVSEREEEIGGTPALVRELIGRTDNAAYPAIDVPIEMTLYLPAEADGSVPAVLSFVFRFPEGVGPPPGWRPDPDPREVVLGHGWALAEIVPTTAQADNGAGLTEGIIGLANRGQPRGADDWGALKAWGWAASRGLDYLEAAPETDGARVVIEGLSRYGKAVLVTMAYDERFAIGFSGSSGEGGGSLYRRDNGETLENLASSGEYHWMGPRFLRYAGPLGVDDLPIDAHSLIALSAPRPLFLGTGTAEAGDAWVDPRGIYLATKAASPVWEMLGEAGLPDGEQPAPGDPAIGGTLVFRQHTGGHTNGPNWAAFLEFADAHFGE